MLSVPVRIPVAVLLHSVINTCWQQPLTAGRRSFLLSQLASLCPSEISPPSSWHLLPTGLTLSSAETASELPWHQHHSTNAPCSGTHIPAPWGQVEGGVSSWSTMTQIIPTSFLSQLQELQLLPAVLLPQNFSVPFLSFSYLNHWFTTLCMRFSPLK